MYRLYKYKTQALVLAVLIVISLGLLCYNSFLQQKLYEINKQYLLEISQKSSFSVQNLVLEQLDMIEAITNIIANEPDYSDEKALHILQHEASRGTFIRLGLIALDGETKTTDNASMNLRDRAYFIKALSGKSNISDRLTDKIGGGYINVFAVPLVVQEKIKGVVIATIDNKNLSDILHIEIFSGEGFAYIIKKDGTPVVYPAHKNNFEEFQDFFAELSSGGVSKEELERVKDDLHNNKSGIIEYSRYGVTRIAAYYPSELNDWYVFSVVPKDSVLRTTTVVIFGSILLTIFISFAFLCLIYYIYNEQKKHLQEIENIAFIDELTLAPTLAKFKLTVQRIMEENPDMAFVIVKLDVADFRLINDTYGFETGDMVIKGIAESARLNTNCENETYARINVDEFVLFHRYINEQHLNDQRAKFMEIFANLMGEQDFNVKFPTGQYMIKSFNAVKDDSISVFEKVNFAHRKAKESWQEIVIDYDDDIKAGIVKAMDIENKMAAAFENEEFVMFLQPKYRLIDETIDGAEALVRWKPKNGDMIFPNDFIPVFEKNGFIVRLDMYMLEQACKLVRKWLDNGNFAPVISVNFSRLHMRNENFVEDISEICDRFSVPHKYIEVEITESTMMDNEDILYTMLLKLHDKGFTASMDDFGTGYSSLGLLRKIPIDVLKIDRSFFLSAHDNDRAKAVLINVLKMARDLTIHTVAEGVEEQGHVNMLKEMGCDMVQGYFFAKPMPVSDFEKKMGNSK